MCPIKDIVQIAILLHNLLYHNRTFSNFYQGLKNLLLPFTHHQNKPSSPIFLQLLHSLK